jgi:demethylmenaquinone methyltransferase/2-methoxy-6-polyprenyl-1,4-benzoquinol methylase
MTQIKPTTLANSENSGATVWSDALLSNPHIVTDKRSRVQKMFAAIAPSYDLCNRLHSLWMDQAWRRKAVKIAQLKPTDAVVDVACGTGDLTLKFAAQLARLSNDARIKPGQVIGIDFTYEMLPIARRKSSDIPIVYLNGDAQSLPLSGSSVDVVSIAFGIRNVADPAAAIREFHRILRPQGRVIILEFSLPTNAILRGLYNFYFRQILPRSATWISGDRTGAYKYLPQSVNTFIDRQTMAELLQSNGFAEVTQRAMTFGVCICYQGIKPSNAPEIRMTKFE